MIPRTSGGPLLERCFLRFKARPANYTAPRTRGFCVFPPAAPRCVLIRFRVHQPQKRPDTGRWLAAAFVLAFAIGAGVGLWQRPHVASSDTIAAGAPSVETHVAALGLSGDVAVPDLAVEEEPPPHRVAAGELVDGETLATSLSVRGISGGQIHTVVTEMAPVFNFRYAKAGDRYRLVLDEAGEIASFVYERSPLDTYELQRNGDSWEASKNQPDLIRRRVRLAGVVTSSLYHAVTALGERAEVAHDFADIFAWDIDFSRTAQPGDEFALLYERLYTQEDDGEELYVRPGQILAARYTSLDGEYQAVYFELDEGRGGYYRPDGSAVERRFLKAPLNYKRISSHYTHSRLHPILKVRRPHLGIDYAAPSGTPVWSVGNGQVVHKSYSGGFGHMIKVRHSDGYESLYGHLSRYAQGLRVGQRVHQKQVIGYVGSTGLSTGPHLDFRLKKDGRYVNPASMRSPAGDPIPSDDRGRFRAEVESLIATLDPTQLVVTNEAL